MTVNSSSSKSPTDIPIPTDNEQKKMKSKLILYMKEIVLKPSSKLDKKFDAIIDNTNVSFGAKGYDHFTEGHLNEARRQSYVNRHSPDENFNNIITAGFWAYRLLWLKKTYRAAIKEIENKFKIKIEYQS